jgi:tRNA-splicing ligase RtcB
MGTFSYVLVGAEKAAGLTFSSTAHGAGRVFSRTYAMEHFTLAGVEKGLDNYGVMIRARSKKGMVEEAPEVYKDINEVARVSDDLGLGLLVARMKPLAVIKG